MKDEFVNFPDLFFCKSYEEAVALNESVNRQPIQSNQSQYRLLETRIENLEARVGKMETAIVSGGDKQ